MRRLLVLEDDPDALEMMCAVLEAGGYAVTRSRYPDQALALLTSETFDLVLADLLLESASVAESWAVIDKVVDLARPATVGLITGWAVTPREMQMHGVAFVIRKPCSRDQLFAQLAAGLHLPELPAEQVHLVREYFDAIERLKFDTLGSLCTEDVLYRLPGADPRFSNEVHGRRAFVEFAERTFGVFRDPQFQISSMRSLPSGALVEYVGSWREGNETRQLPGAVMFEFRNSAIERIQVRVSTEELR